MNSINRRVCESAIEAFGAEAQIDHMIEEAGELIVAIMELKRNNGKHRGRVSAVIDEIADVAIMIEQMKMIFDVDTCNARIDEKTQRLANRITENHYGKKSTHIGDSPQDREEA